MHYIINPIYFYLIDLTGNTASLLKFLVVLSALAAVICLIWWEGVKMDEKPSKYEDIPFETKPKEQYEQEMEEFKNKLKYPFGLFKNFFILTIVCGAISLFIPSQETCYKMMIASVVTEENIEKVEEKVQSIIEYAVELQDARESKDE